MQRKKARLGRCLAVRGDTSEWEVELEGGAARAIAYASLTGEVEPGTEVLLNTTAEALSLGTGGTHFVIAALEGDADGGEFAGREGGHVLRLRYTPLQVRVQAVEEEGSPHRDQILGFNSLHGMPVLAAELHSQAAAAALAAKHAKPSLRIAWVQLDTAALPVGLSRLLFRLREEGVIEAVVSVGQGFGGDYEAVNVYTGLITAREVVKAELTIVTQGPGNVGTGTEWGFSGISLAEALHAAHTLGGRAILAARMSEGDARERHRGLSHHTVTLFTRCLHVPAELPVPTMRLSDALAALGDSAHGQVIGVDAGDALSCLADYELSLSTMGRGPDQDRLFFEAAAAAGVYAAGRVRSEGG
jgi:hypothetical protein